MIFLHILKLKRKHLMNCIHYTGANISHFPALATCIMNDTHLIDILVNIEEESYMAAF